jgi:OOP family OmpA-OmpF porin
MMATLKGQAEKGNPVTGGNFFSFEGNVKYLGSLRGVFTLGNISYQKRQNKLHLYLVAGVGLGSFKAKYRNATTEGGLSGVPWIEQDDLSATVIEGAAGLKYRLGKKVDLHLEYSYYHSNSDLLDAFRVPASGTDAFSYINLGLTYTFGKKSQSMEWVNPMETIYSDMNDMKDKMDALTGDKDKDGVADIFDKDNNTPEGVKVYGDGTAVDTDGDGIPDSKDADPFTNKGAVVDATGKEADSDGDGVPDSKDLEPNTPAGQLVNFQGKSIIITSSSTSMAAAYWPSVYFGLNSAKIMAGSNSSIATVAMTLKNNPDLKVTITGNADKTGSEKVNTELGQKRADAVKDALVKQYGIDAARLSTTTKGESDPLNMKTNSVNRRVDFTVMK